MGRWNLDLPDRSQAFLPGMCSLNRELLGKPPELCALIKKAYEPPEPAGESRKLNQYYHSFQPGLYGSVVV